MPVSGVRRSWPTAASSAARTRSIAARSRAWAAWSARRCASRVRAAAAMVSRARGAAVLGEDLRTPGGQPQPAAGHHGQHRATRWRRSDGGDGVFASRTALQQRDRGHAERVADLAEQAGQRLLGDRLGGGTGEQGGLDGTAGGPFPLPGGHLHGNADRGGDQHVDDQGDDVVAAFTTRVWCGGMKKKLTTRSAPTATARTGHTPPIAAAASTGTRNSSATLVCDRAARCGASSAVSPARPTAAATSPHQARRADTPRRPPVLTIPLYGYQRRRAAAPAVRAGAHRHDWTPAARARWSPSPRAGTAAEP